jgi:hypothetical protein
VNQQKVTQLPEGGRIILVDEREGQKRDRWYVSLETSSTVDNLWIVESQWYQAVLILIAAGGLRRPEDEITKKQDNIADGLRTFR